MARMRLAMIAAMFAGLTGAAPHPDYRAGQVWAYHTRMGDEGSLLRIQQVEQLDGDAAPGPVYHISIVGVHFASAPEANKIQHVPVSRAALDASVTHLASSRIAFPDAAQDIADWRAAHGRVFTIPVADIVATMERMLQAPRDGEAAPAATTV